MFPLQMQVELADKRQRGGETTGHILLSHGVQNAEYGKKLKHTARRASQTKRNSILGSLNSHTHQGVVGQPQEEFNNSLYSPPPLPLSLSSTPLTLLIEA